MEASGTFPYSCVASFMMAERVWYYNRLISGNINQVVHVDSVVCDFAVYPYKATTYARQMIIRESNVTERSLVTSCSLQNTGRSDDNPNGFIIEQFTILENKDIRSAER